MPLTSSSSPIDQFSHQSPDEAVAFMGLNLDAFKQLVSFVDLSADFTLAIAEVNYGADVDWVVQALRQHPIAQTVELIELDYTERNDDYSLFVELRRELADRPIDPQRPPLLLVRGLATAIGVKGDYLNFINDLNFRRDAMARAVPYPMVWFLPDYAISRLAKNARDLWSWHSALFSFRTVRSEAPAPSPPDQVQAQPAQPPLPPDAKAAKQERVEQLERLLSEQRENLKACIELALELGKTYRGLSDYGQAKKHYRQALEWAELENETFNQANGHRGLGFIYYFNGENNKSLESYGQALQLYRDVGDRLGEANTLQAVGDVLQFLKRSQEALKNYEEALGLYRDVGDRLGEANTLQAVGDVLQFLKRSQEALKNYEEALGLYRDVGARLGEANTLKAVGDVLQFLDRRQEALKNYEEALGLYRDVGARLGEANVLQEFGKLQESPQKSLDLLQEAQVLYETIGDRYSQCRNLLRFIAKKQLELGNKQQALNSLHGAADLAKDTEFTFFREDALKAIDNIQNDSKPSLSKQVHHSWRQRFVLGLVCGIVLALILGWLL